MAATEDRLSMLAHAAAHGDDGALRDLVRSTEPAVVGLCRHLGSSGDAEDLAQETYLRAIRALPSYRGEAPVMVWLLGIARHVCADHVRRRTRRARIDRRLSVPDSSIVGLPAWSDVDDLLQRLDDDQRVAFVLTQLLELSYEQAAEVCECPIGTIRSRVARARARLLDEVRAADAS